MHTLLTTILPNINDRILSFWIVGCITNTVIYIKPWIFIEKNPHHWKFKLYQNSRHFGSTGHKLDTRSVLHAFQKNAWKGSHTTASSLLPFLPIKENQTHRSGNPTHSDLGQEDQWSQGFNSGHHLSSLFAAGVGFRAGRKEIGTEHLPYSFSVGREMKEFGFYSGRSGEPCSVFSREVTWLDEF